MIQKLKSHRHVEWLLYVLFVFLLSFFFFASSAANDFRSLMILSESNFNPTKLSTFLLYFYLAAILFISLSGFYFNAYSTALCIFLLMFVAIFCKREKENRNKYEIFLLNCILKFIWVCFCRHLCFCLLKRNMGIISYVCYNK